MIGTQNPPQFVQSSYVSDVNSTSTPPISGEFDLKPVQN